MSVSSPSRTHRAKGASDMLRQPRIAVIGAGFSGMGLGIRLKGAGLTDFTIFEKASTVGGTWRDNTYPGLSCDIPSRYYSYSFAPNPYWSKSFSPGPEIQRYIEKVAKKADIKKWIKFGTTVTSVKWDGRHWQLAAGDRDLGEFDFVVSAVGFLHHPTFPDIDGLDSFAGTLVHTAQWDSSTQWAGKRVGVIGTGSSGTQVVGSCRRRRCVAGALREDTAVDDPDGQDPVQPARKAGRAIRPRAVEAHLRLLGEGAGRVRRALHRAWRGPGGLQAGAARLPRRSRGRPESCVPS
ncbi:flavin-containing monooxygenase [Aeromicrobium sp. UC242_57]|uniref:flavin-containing monooxygenase n=1 Tax=Aeromicrobium sp. UC242_57 TaxID=3374624 RepID=UPI0037A4E190